MDTDERYLAAYMAQVIYVSSSHDHIISSSMVPWECLNNKLNSFPKF